jgi:hypothetical protein
VTPRRVVLDTDVASLSIEHALPPWLLAELVGAQAAISFVTLGELTRWASAGHAERQGLPRLRRTRRPSAHPTVRIAISCRSRRSA